MSAKLRLQTYGGFRLFADDGQTVVIALRKAEALLAYLSAAPGQTCSREGLAELMWSAYDQQHARHSLRQVLLSITKAAAEIGIPLLKLDSQKITLDTSRLSLDVVELEELLDQGTPEAGASALTFYRGPFLSGMPAIAAEFDDWLSTARAKFHAQCLDAALNLLGHHEGRGRTDRAIEIALRCLLLDPLREDVHRRLMRLYARGGMRSSALFQYRTCRDVLARELDVEPDQETSDLHRQILNGRQFSSASAAPSNDLRNAVDVREDPATSMVQADGVGRHAQLRALIVAFANLTREGPRFIEVDGEAGVGKTHLIKAFEGRLANENAALVWCRVRPSEQAMPLALCRDLSKSLPPIDGLSHIFDRTAQALIAASQRQSLVVVLENLHEGDQESIEFVSYAARHCAQFPVLFVATMRSDYRGRHSAARPILDALLQEGVAIKISLNPLSAAETTSLIQTLIPTTYVDPPIKKMSSLSQGNPHVVLELCASLGKRRTRGQDRGVRLPTSIRDEIIASGSELSATATELLAVASVAGPVVEWPVLEKASGIDPVTAARGLQELVDNDLLTLENEAVRFTKNRYAAAYNDHLVPARRSLMHASVAKSLERAFRRSLDPHFRALAYHWRESGHLTTALEYEIRAAQSEAKKGALARPRSSFRRVLRELETAENTYACSRVEIDACLGLAMIGEREGKTDDMAGLLARAEILAGRINDPGRLAAAQLALGRLAYLGGEKEESYRFYRDGLATDRLSVSGHPWHPAEQLITHAHMINTSHDAGAAALDRQRTRLHRLGLPSEEADATLALAVFHAMRGAFGDAIREAEIAVKMAEQIGSDATLAACLQYAGTIRAWHNDFEAAQALFDRAMEIAESHGELLRMYSLQAWKGYACVGAGNYQAAVDLLLGAAALAERLETKLLLPFVLAWMADAYLGLGDEGRALELGRGASALATDVNQTWAKSLGARVVARALANSGVRHLPLAERTIRTAMEEQRTLGVRFEFAQSAVVYGKIMRARGRIRRSRDVFTNAEEMYAEMGMTAESMRAKTLAESLRPLPDIQL